VPDPEKAIRLTYEECVKPSGLELDYETFRTLVHYVYERLRGGSPPKPNVPFIDMLDRLISLIKLVRVQAGKRFRGMRDVPQDVEASYLDAADLTFFLCLLIRSVSLAKTDPEKAIDMLFEGLCKHGLAIVLMRITCMTLEELYAVLITMPILLALFT